LHEDAFGGRALPGPAGGAIALPQTPLPLFGERKKGKREINIGKRIGREERGLWKRVGRDRKKEKERSVFI